MEPLTMAATQRSPEVEFDFDSGHFLMRGEIFPEDAAAFFGPILERMEAYVRGLGGATITFDFKLQYFNSSSAKGLMNLFRLLEHAAENGNTVQINWYYYEDDDTIFEAGEDFAEDLEKAAFSMCPLEVA
jgi:hypothetical protein